MVKISKEVKIGIAFLIAIFILYFGISFLKGVNIFNSTNSYVVLFDNVSGLTQSTPITISGLQIGQVNYIGLDPNNINRVITKVNLNDDIKVTKGSKFVLDVSALGSAVIALEMNTNSSELMAPNDTTQGIRHKGMMDAVGGMLPQISDLVPKLDSILIGIRGIANDPALTQTLANVNQISYDLTKSTAELNILLAALNKDIPMITRDLAVTANNVAGVSAKLESIDLNSTYESIDVTMKNLQYLSERLKSKDNTVGLLLNDKQMYDSLNMTISNATLLLKDIRENPQRYINVKVF